MAINNRMVSKVELYGGEMKNDGSYLWLLIMKNAELPDQVIYTYDKKADDNVIDKKFFKRFCSVFGKGTYKVKTNDDWLNLEEIITVEDDD